MIDAMPTPTSLPATPERSEVLQLEHVTKLYGTVMGVNDITCSLAPGGYGLIGPNGAGKTTLLHLLVGILQPTLGVVRVLRQDPHQRKRLLDQIGYCPAQDGLYGYVTGYQWVRYLLELRGVSARQAAERAEQVLCEVGLHDSMNRAMGTYSRGMRQRVKLAQAFSHDPAVLILDEPFNGLDPIARHDMTEWLKAWLQSGKSLILASHVLHEVEAVTPSFLLICGGRLLASGGAHEVHQMLAGVPHEVRLECDRREELAGALLREKLADAVHMSNKPGELVVSTRTPLDLFHRLPRLQSEDDIGIFQLESMDDSLQSLFDKLFRLHRGEL
jgi:ABC-2 type transport system ATP-binding protein